MKAYYDGAIPWVKTLDLNCGIVKHTEESITVEGLRSIRDGFNPPGTVMVAMYGGAGTIGKSGVLGIAAATNQAIASILPDASIFDSDFLHYQLMHLRSTWMQFSQGNRKDPNINKSVVEDMLVWLPENMSKQKAIGAAIKAQLAAAEEARQAALAQLAELRRLKTQSLSAIFSSIGKRSPIGAVAKLQSGYAFKSQSFQKQGIRLLRNANILPGKVYWDDTVFLAPSNAKSHETYALCAGDILISLDRPIISSGIKVARFSENDLPALLVQRVGRFLINKDLLEADYLYAFLQSTSFIEAISGHGQSLGVPHISPSQIENIEIPLPDLIEQKRLAIVLTELTAHIQTAEIAAGQQLRDIELLPSRLLAEAFNP
ncbi:MAG: hypothetical protein A3I66_07840 [Burkholderiales bacterium RIFCSPLOWO2_02_FULL_57_36]|nr:MAG: hypothetical protein A3I66_07840 [Burkholderiales bacterium RIFCSPLOWO2_02_FULL_57_36]